MFCNTKFIANLFLFAALEWNINRQEKAMEICQKAIDRSIQAESFRGLLPLLKQRLFFEKQLKWNQEEQILCDTVFRMDHGKIIATETN